MVNDDVIWPSIGRRAASAVAAAVLSLACFNGTAVHAQTFSPHLNVESHIPNINANVGVGPSHIPNINPNVGPKLPSVRFSPNFHPPCDSALRDAGGGCTSQPASSAGGGGAADKGGGGNNGKRRGSQTAGNPRAIANELVAEIDGSLSEAQADELARRYGLTRLELRNFPLIGATIGLFRVTGRRSFEAASRDFGNHSAVRSVQPNFRYVLQEERAALTEGDPAQYVIAKLRLAEAHALAHGTGVTIAVIDSGIDTGHSELADAIADSFDALGGKDDPHSHGTGVAGAIVSHARLTGSAPAAKILAIRAFGAVPSGAESTSYVILKGLDYAAAHGARIVNMSFAGPKDALIERGIASTAAKGIVMVAASGNAGPKSPALYPAANANVIAVSATDAQDRVFSAANRGGHIALAAPGVDVFLPAPGEKYQMASGTSFSAAYISGVVALMLERNTALKPEEVRAILTKTARDLGPPGRDDLFGAGAADAYAAVLAATNATEAPVATVPGPPKGENSKGGNPAKPGGAPARSVEQSAPTLASEKSVPVELPGAR